ncbi:response regulator [Planktothrix sp. FACHB-1355]|uniref:Response regulator n=1 Tax=Aerosakkonema funiforme FACHB-1375 TaxID=2949571 RepID=A0A926VMB3_9CYAN|nr:MULTISPECIES: response regulator [Oscillatoriales]MBD2185442.1 response regulator [Aerosakkonema funiforme FACHB-1375]MBD3562943.1 response regulator [Planktothrix sp. FACHB-1355]
MVAKRILIIDDEDDIREIAQVSLETMGGWEVLTAASGNEGLAIASEQALDAILLDVMMPDMDGPTIFQKLQANKATQHIPVVLLTAKVQAAEQRRFAQLGVKAVLTKPFDPMILATQLAKALNWSQ